MEDPTGSVRPHYWTTGACPRAGPMEGKDSEWVTLLVIRSVKVCNLHWLAHRRIRVDFTQRVFEGACCSPR